MNRNSIVPVAVIQRTRTLAFVATFMAVVATTVCAEEDRLILLNGQSVATTITGITAEGTIQGRGLPPKLDLDGIRRIERPAGLAKNPPASVVVDLHGGGRMSARQMTIGDEQCQIDWYLGEKLSLPIDVVRAIRFLPTKKTPVEFELALAKPSPDNDRLFVVIDEKVQVVTGLIEELTAEKVIFFRDDQEHALPLNKLYAVVLAQVDPPEKPHLLVQFQDGSQLPATNLSLDGEQCKLQLAGDAMTELSWKTVSRIEVNSTRMTFVSDLIPVEVVQRPIVTFGQPWRRDRSVDGRPLTIENQKFKKGLGVHSECRLAFDTGDGYDTFAAMIGIDAETNGKGDCLLHVLGDGKTLFTQRVRGGQPPIAVRVDIAGVKRLTLLVEPGEDLDLADHADWCDARLIRLAK